MQKYIENLQFITHDLPHKTHVEQATIACSAGAKWIQYRCLTKDDAGLLSDIGEIGEICDDWGATLIVTDHIHLAGKGDIQGFHIEDMDADFTRIRQQLGDEFTLGGSSNTLENALRIAAEGADYIGLGPFAETLTKPNNFPLIGLDTYRNYAEQMKLQFDTPLIAVGGITLHDVSDLMETGIYGIAVSNDLNAATDFYEQYQMYRDRIAISG